MKNKVLVRLYVPSIHEEFELFIPTNECIKKVIDLILKSIEEISDGVLSSKNNYCIIDPETSIVYDNACIIRNTNIKNDKKLILI